ncbi:MAG: DUF4410 domain-containing protein [Candidatus Omnitrophota bacterium]|jgi:hypothetical protein
MKRRLIVAVVFFVVSSVIAFVSPVLAVEKSAQTTICVLFDNGVSENLDARQAKARTQLADWMKEDLVRVFARYAKAGYEAKVIEKRRDFESQPNNYLLTVKITEYRAGSKAARAFVGYGAGGVNLKIHYEFFGAEAKAILNKDDSVFSGREWTNAARKLNENMTKAVIGELGSE